ncbi:MAG: chromosome segregation protein, partial [Actinomycetota bacterium]|nr:chromosome segregation protein [Actinomycetota bacterium]
MPGTGGDQARNVRSAAARDATPTIGAGEGAFLFLKSLTLKGFKSFADKTTLEFEPGVCVVVGPNGSGKSNIVDSVAWVLGAQGARALRGTKMDDVIFAGTADRPALGRAEVSLTIDNTAHLLPIEFTEVTITRMLFRTGESEYLMNGVPCRLLDIQDLLSDTGIGRQQHVIVGQGQLDAVLNSRPEDRRAIIEEAAGVLKFRKRKEKAERRLEATEGNLMRLTDLLREVRRQLRPLERQADAARRHDGLVDEVRAIRLHLAGRDIEQLRGRERKRVESRRDLAEREQDVRVQLRALDAEVLDAEHALAVPGDDDVADVLARTEALRERGRGLVNLVSERGRGLDRELASVADEGVVESLVAEAAHVRGQLAAVDADFDSLAPTRLEVEGAEAKVESLGVVSISVAEGEFQRAAQELDQLTSRAGSVGSELERVRGELARVEAEHVALEPRIREADAARAQAERARLEIETHVGVSPDLTDEARELRGAEDALRDADAEHRRADSDASRWRARAEMLALALDEVHAAAGGEEIADLDGVLGPLVDLLEIDEGCEIAVAAALGDALKAVVVEGDDAARAAVERLKRGDRQALLLVAEGRTSGMQISFAPAGSHPLGASVRGLRPGLDAVLARLFAQFVLVDGAWEHALDVALANPGLVAVTRDGDRFGGPSAWRAGPSGSSIVTPAALADATAEADAAEVARDLAEAEVEVARQRLAAARRAELRATEEERRRRVELERLTAHAAQLRREVEVGAATLDARRNPLSARADELALAAASMGPEAESDARARVAAARQQRDEARTRRAEMEHLRSQAAALRRDYELRGAAVEERRAVLTARLGEVEARLAVRPDEEAAARARRVALEGRRAAVAEVAARLGARAGEIEALAERLRARRRLQSEAARAAGRRLDGLRARRAAAEKQLTELRELASKLEVEEAEIRLRLEQAVEQVRRDFDCEPDAAIAAAVPEVPDGNTLPGRARELERELRLMGPVNPLALTESEALLERHEFLQKQLDDVRNTRRELARVIKAVDEEIVRVFDSAFTDVARNFSELFSMLFPGGSGRLVLTQPDDLLNSGIEMEARPSGKTVRRLSLLSGGERSLCALAYLFSVFRARPSPFYLMDEVEAALDDV